MPQAPERGLACPEPVEGPAAPQPPKQREESDRGRPACGHLADRTDVTGFTPVRASPSRPHYDVVFARFRKLVSKQRGLGCFFVRGRDELSLLFREGGQEDAPGD